MPKPISNNVFGVDGVNLVKDPLKLTLSEATQLQNAELLMDEATGGAAALKMRGGLAALNGSALASTVLGVFGWPLRTTYTRTIYAARQTEDSNTFKTSSAGTSWADSALPSAAAAEAKFADEDNSRTQRRLRAYRSFVLYAGNGYTKGTDDPILTLWDGTNAFTVTSIKYGPSSNGSVPFAITDVYVANGLLYLAIHDQGGTAPNLSGRVVSVNLDTGQVKQIANSFGSGTGEVAGGAPACLYFYKGELFVGLNTGNTTNGIGKIVRCFPGVDTTWTADVSNLVQGVTSMVAFKGDLYATTRSSASAAEVITRRAATGTTWATVDTGVGSAGNGHYAHLTVHESALYAVDYHATAPTIHIRTSTDGTSWSTSRDVDSSDGGAAGNLPGGSLSYNSALYFVFRSTTATATDGFIMRFASAAWTKIDTDNYLGPIGVLTQRTA